jgi:type IV secretory pathway VirB10-like protein
MSLINDALKKAARQRAEEQADVVAPMPGGGRRVSRQGAPMRTQTMVLIGAAALALVVVSAVVTGVLMTGNPEAKPQSPPAQAPAAPNVVVQAPAVAVVLPQQSVPAPVAAKVAPAVSTPPAATVHVEPALPSPTPPPPAVVQTPAIPAQIPAPAAQVQAPPAQAPAASAPVAAAVQSHADMVQGVVDAYHISGVRLAGAGSKALIDGHVYKLNDVVDKTLGLKLAKVDEDHLTFVDRDGNTFTKTF